MSAGAATAREVRPRPRAPGPAALPGLSPALFERFGALVRERCGINVTPAKKTMLEARLRKRLRSLSLPSFEEYGRLVFSPGGLERELPHLLDEVSTNKTDFFREGAQFDFLLRTALPGLTAAGRGMRAPLRAWSAGCSTGEEPYTIAMSLEECRAARPEFRYQVLGTDLSTRVLAAAARGVYPEGRLDPVPEALRRRYFRRSRDRGRGLVRVAPELRARVTFRRLNFRDPGPLAVPQAELIFCRNVLIYFDKDFQRDLLLRLCERLSPGGHLFLGHTESVFGMGLPLLPVGHAVYRRAE